MFFHFLLQIQPFHWIKWILESRNPPWITPEYAWLSEIRWVDYPWIETTTQTQFLCCARQMDFDADRL